VCSAVEEIAETAAELADEVGEFIEQALESDIDFSNETDAETVKPMSNANGSENEVVTDGSNQQCDEALGSVLCERYNYDSIALEQRGQHCCNVSRNILIDLVAGFETGLFPSSLPVNECQADLEAFRDHFESGGGGLENSFNIPTVEVPMFSGDLSEADLDQLFEDTVASLNEVVNNFPRCE